MGEVNAATTEASRPQLIRLRTGHLVQLRPVRPSDAPAVARAYRDLGEQSRYRRFFTLMPELSESTLRAATEVDHTDHEALVASPPLSADIVGEARFVRSAEHPDTADVAVTVVDGWQGRGVGSALLRRLSQRAVEVGVHHFTAEILAENRTMLAMLPNLGRVETRADGSVVSARIEIAQPPQPTRHGLLDLLRAAARGEIVCVPTALRRMLRPRS